MYSFSAIYGACKMFNDVKLSAGDTDYHYKRDFFPQWLLCSHYDMWYLWRLE